MYAALERDGNAHVQWYAPLSGEGHFGAFAAGTVAYRQTEKMVRKSLPASLLARLLTYVALMPQRLLARRAWEKVIPYTGIGYVLTIGVAPVVPKPARGRDVLANLESWFIQRGCTESWLDTEAANVRALEFYKRLGYKEVSRRYGQILLAKQLVDRSSSADSTKPRH